MYLLDTNVLSALRRPSRSPALVAWLRRQDEAQLYVSVVTLGEIERGIALQDRHAPAFAADLRAWIDATTAIFADRLVSFGAEEARLWGRLSAELGHDGADLLIAATALVRGWTVVTGNRRHFEPTGVALLDPSRG
jgi:toxin FitB